jgi:hypothetical protein
MAFSEALKALWLVPGIQAAPAWTIVVTVLIKIYMSLEDVRNNSGRSDEEIKAELKELATKRGKI